MTAGFLDNAIPLFDETIVRTTGAGVVAVAENLVTGDAVGFDAVAELDFEGVAGPSLRKQSKDRRSVVAVEEVAVLGDPTNGRRRGDELAGRVETHLRDAASLALDFDITIGAGAGTVR